MLPRRAGGSKTREDVAVGELLVATGPPGAGKSTVATVLAAGFSCSALVAGDQFFAFINQGYVNAGLPPIVRASAPAASETRTAKPAPPTRIATVASRDGIPSTAMPQ
jgi:hypothetical protein